MKVITITAQFANGKDVVCEHLSKVLSNENEQWRKASFARAVKDIFCDAFGVDEEFIEKWKRIPECPDGFLKPVRQSLQFIGDGFRQIRPNIWIEIAFRKMRECSIVADGRYFNEAIATKKNGGLNILVWRQGFVNADPNPSESQILPVVEWFKGIYESSGAEGYLWDKVDYPDNLPQAKYYDLFIANTGTLEDLHAKLDRLVVPYVTHFYSHT